MGTAVAGFGPVLPGVFGADRTSVFGQRRERDAGNGEADHLALAATEAANRVAHKDYLPEIFRAQAGAAEGLARTVFALDGHCAA